MIKQLKYVGILSLALISTSTAFAADAPNWTWSEGLKTYYYRDNDGRVHYGDGSVSGTNTSWSDSSGKTVYSANSAGPADKTGQYAYKAKAVDTSKTAAPPPAPVVTTPAKTGGAVFGGSVSGSTGTKTTTTTASTSSAWKGTDSSLWQWSEGLQSYYYRDNDGKVHYSDGSVSGSNTTWSDSSGKTVYAANSAGPADKTGQYAYKAAPVDISNVGPPPAAPISAPVASGGAVFGPSRTANVSTGTMSAATAALNNKGSSKNGSGATVATASVPSWATE